MNSDKRPHSYKGKDKTGECTIYWYDLTTHFYVTGVSVGGVWYLILGHTWSSNILLSTATFCMFLQVLIYSPIFSHA